MKPERVRSSLAKAWITGSGTVLRHIRLRYAKALSTSSVILKKPPERMELPPGCSIFSRIMVLAPWSWATMAATPPEYPYPTTTTSTSRSQDVFMVHPR